MGYSHSYTLMGTARWAMEARDLHQRVVLEVVVRATCVKTVYRYSSAPFFFFEFYTPSNLQLQSATIKVNGTVQKGDGGALIEELRMKQGVRRERGGGEGMTRKCRGEGKRKKKES
jgi:hypothetical protein